MAFCVLCFRKYTHAGGDDFCSVCEEAWHCLRLDAGQRRLRPTGKPYEILSDYAYGGICRASILACKGQGFRRVGQALARRIVKHSEVFELARQSDVIMPAPSSLWSRCHGCLDLAAYLAESLAVGAGRLVQAPPLSLGFRWRKQALRDRRAKSRVFSSSRRLYDASYFQSRMPVHRQNERPVVLIVDDVVTTAHTLIDLADCFSKVDFKFYTLASAFRLSDNVGRTLMRSPDTEG